MFKDIGDSIFKGVTDGVFASEAERQKRDAKHEAYNQANKEAGLVGNTVRSFKNGVWAGSQNKREAGMPQSRRRYYPELDEKQNPAKSVDEPEFG